MTASDTCDTAFFAHFLNKWDVVVVVKIAGIEVYGKITGIKIGVKGAVIEVDS